jgi:hypothetical protein
MGVTRVSALVPKRSTMTMREQGMDTVQLTYNANQWAGIAHPTAVDSVLRFVQNCERDLRMLNILAKDGNQDDGWVYEVRVSDDHERLYMVLNGAWTIHEVRVAPEGGLDLIEVYTPSQGEQDALQHLQTALRASKSFELIL